MNCELIIPSETVSFIGYLSGQIQKSQPGNDFIFAEIQARILGTIHNLAARGYTTFLSGMSEGFDLMAASAVLLARNTYPTIKLVSVVPFPQQAKMFAPFWRFEHARISKHSQRNVILSDHNFNGVFCNRNDFLVDNASLVVCYYDGQPGDTHYTLKNANARKLEIINLFWEQVFEQE